MFENLSLVHKIKIMRKALLLLLFAVLFYLLITPLYNASVSHKIIDAFISSLNIILLHLILMIRGNQNPLIISYNWRTVRIFLLGLFFVLCCYPGISLLLAFIFMGKTFIATIAATIPIRIGVALTICYIVHIQTKNRLVDTFEIEQTECHEPPTPPAISTKKTDSHLETDAEQILERIAVKVRDKLVVIPVEQLYYLKADGDYVQLHTANATYLKEQTMKYFENALPQNLFVRIHRSYIVNVETISGIAQYGKQTRQITLKNGDKILVSDNGYKALRKKLGL
ncbi:LytTR family transcriptional regulator DNA-binding domain-containing protein [Bacteroidales bacterium OttesenSCG-928-B11]|nr:LytTR family transcriptional regulator DNA-binding domain-containing protein [Bacteroidales bacterium OttesenSCG-928-E04]MDL2311345.1 LytTR family transcriptional regulator DNA-binding domain-containing protein [Bacteroidales bacterium OttesenSCG-928-B11]